MRPLLAFVGNRRAPLSREFFHGLRAAQAGGAPRFGLLLVDASTAGQFSLRRRTRDRTIRLLKAVLGAGGTSTLDWFRERAARQTVRLTPPGHDLNAPGFAPVLAARGVDAALVAGCDQILGREFVRAVARIVNFHNGLLPEYRGVQCVEWAFLNREAVAGYTFHTIEDEGIDRGRVVLRRELPVAAGQTPAEFDRRLVADAVAHLPAVLAALLEPPTWPPAGPALGPGGYYSAKRMRHARRFDPGLPVTETLHRFGILGSLDIAGRRLPLKITALERAAAPESLAVGCWTRRGGALVVRCADGGVAIRGIDHLPAAVLAPLVPAVLEARSGA